MAHYLDKVVATDFMKVPMTSAMIAAYIKAQYELDSTSGSH
ncbi:MAG TPA: hypothetical protein VNQ80_05760 [Parapedobacter sp.]|nr:hypothetical protein [Parapedobacter sp.]HWK56818.1 hypothetical protein [Parapedobacter sp.]